MREEDFAWLSCDDLWLPKNLGMRDREEIVDAKTIASVARKVKRG